MRFALLGDHPDGVALACALAASGRHRVLAYTGALTEEVLRRLGNEARKVSDPEEVLADPAIEAVIVASPPSLRPVHLRRSLQSERHVLCVHPPDQTPEIAYEAAMIRDDTGCLLLPILPEATHPAFRRLAEFVVRKEAASSSIGTFRLLQMERGVSGEILDGIRIAGQKPSFPDWDVLRTLGGEIQEVSAFAESEELREGEPVLISGRFERGGLFHVTLIPREQEPSWRLTAIGSQGRAELVFPLGWQGPAFLDWHDADGESREESWEYWDPWPVLVEAFERRIEPSPPSASAPLSVSAPSSPLPLGGRGVGGEVAAIPQQTHPLTPTPLPLSTGGEGLQRQTQSWQDATRALELDDATRRSVERRRASVLEYPEATEQVGFKGTMTLVGCAMMWCVLVLLILSVWWPRIGWLIVPLIVVFLALQFLRYVVPDRHEK
jgi:myo-inositol 2-dehydrogenase/D-chiro-inositol 1-dehydrogenase